MRSACVLAWHNVHSRIDGAGEKWAADLEAFRYSMYGTPGEQFSNVVYAVGSCGYLQQPEHVEQYITGGVEAHQPKAECNEYSISTVWCEWDPEEVVFQPEIPDMAADPGDVSEDDRSFS